jgi:hypothetical protein
LLIGVNAPFSIGGTTTGHHIPLWIVDDGYVGDHRCVGWDLVPDATSATNRLRSESLSAITTTDENTRVWWVNSNLFDPVHGTLLTPNDRGSGCFRYINDLAHLTAVHVSTPQTTHDGRLNSAEESYSITVASGSVHKWIDDVLWEVSGYARPFVWGDVAVCSMNPDSIEMFGLGEDGSLHWWRQSGWPSSAGASWIDLPALDPPERVALASDRPGVVCMPDGTIELFARADDGTVWWQRYREGAWAEDWEQLDSAVATSGLSAVGVRPGWFQLFARGEDQGLRRAVYQESEWIEPWQHLNGYILGAPSARMAHTTVWDAYVRDTNGYLSTWRNRFGVEAWAWYEPVFSDPAVVSWSDERIDIFTRTEDDRLRRHSDRTVAMAPTVDAEVVLVPGDLTAVAREPGRFEVFISRQARMLWHAFWPRDPRSE